MRTLTWFSPESPLVRFGACSVLLHIGILAAISALPGTHSTDTPRQLVTVTLVDPPQPVPEDVLPEVTPPMLQAQRQAQPVASHQARPSTPHQRRLPPQYPVQTPDVPLPPTPPAAPPVTRAPLADHLAADALEAVPLEAPPMLHAQQQERPAAPLQARPSQPPRRLHPPARYATQATDILPSSTRPAASPVTRAPLSDHLAADALEAMPLETPPMLHAQRQAQPVAPLQARPAPSQHQLHLSPRHVTRATDPPPPSTRPAAPPVTRAPLSDHLAADALKAVPLKTPPMLHAQRQAQPVASPQARPSTSQHQFHLPPQYPTRATATSPSLARHVAPPITREPLSDHDAADTLKLKGLMKMPARRATTATHATSGPPEPPLVIARRNITNVWSLREVPTPSLPATRTNVPGISKVFRDTTADRKGLRTTARLVQKSDPPYPPIAREQGWEGTVMLRLAITHEGAVEHATIHTSSGFPVLDESAHQTVLQADKWKFEPARDGEFTIPSKVDVPIRFSLKEDNRRARETP